MWRILVFVVLSGISTCLAKTELDSISANVPNPPSVYVNCNSRDAVVNWESQGDNRSPILFYTIQYNTSFTPDTWEIAAKDIPATKSSYTVGMSPWADYTFRVIAHNKIGPSVPSGHSELCTTPEDVPYKNPENVEGKGTKPNNLIIKWTPMEEIDHNARQFHYRVSYKEDVPGAHYITEDIYNWKVSEITVHDTPTFAKYKIKVQALNPEGKANVAVKEIIGYSGEDEPLEAPQNLILVRIISETSAMLQWNAVDPSSVRGHFRGYKIQTRSYHQDDINEINVSSDATLFLVTNLIPHAKNYARVMVYNDSFDGPPSNIIEIDTSQIASDPV